MASQITAELQEKFHALYGGAPRVFRAPGRVNLIGEHTDYNDGFVMPAAIEFYTWVAMGPRHDRKIAIHSTNFSDTIELDLDARDARAAGRWSDYIQGVALILERAGYRLRGANILIRGEVPIGSGLSSSAAVEVAAALALLGNSGLSLDRVELAKLCRRAENEFVGARVGIMDQFISCNGHRGRALMLDCRSLQFRLLPLPAAATLVICNTMVKHELASGEYNTRRAECEEGVRLLAQRLAGIRALRDVSLDQLEQQANALAKTTYRRCHHVVSENQRVLDAASALERSDLERFGRLMGDSHRSLRDDYEVSCAELDLMVDLATRQPGVYGARMTGGGFGGCTINIVRTEDVSTFRENVAREYQRATGLTPEVFVSSAAEGAGEVELA